MNTNKKSSYFTESKSLRDFNVQLNRFKEDVHKNINFTTEDSLKINGTLKGIEEYVNHYISHPVDDYDIAVRNYILTFLERYIKFRRFYVLNLSNNNSGFNLDIQLDSKKDVEFPNLFKSGYYKLSFVGKYLRTYSPVDRGLIETQITSIISTPKLIGIYSRLFVYETLDKKSTNCY